jgi:Uri superfamily endonuclease
MDDLPVQPGTYALILELGESRTLQVGRLGSNNFPAGYYVYLGSAQGSGGLRGRLSRHLRGGGKTHWHIDRLLPFASLHGYAYVVFGREKDDFGPTECVWSQTLIASTGANIPAPNFGASDCRSGCPTHLVHYPELDFLEQLSSVLKPASDVMDFKLVYPWRLDLTS